MDVCVTRYVQQESRRSRTDTNVTVAQHTDTSGIVRDDVQRICGKGTEKVVRTINKRRIVSNQLPEQPVAAVEFQRTSAIWCEENVVGIAIVWWQDQTVVLYQGGVGRCFKVDTVKRTHRGATVVEDRALTLQRTSLGHRHGCYECH